MYDSQLGASFISSQFIDAAGHICFTWTISLRLGSYIQMAVDEFGPLDQTWTIIGVAFNGDQPMIWYPTFGDGKYCLIFLSLDETFNLNNSLFQLAHEVVHLLAPDRDRPANKFEEGLATMFADSISAKENLGFRSVNPKYLEAKSLMEKLTAIQPNAVKLLRGLKPNMRDLTPSIITDAIPAVPTTLAVSLCELF